MMGIMEKREKTNAKETKVLVIDDDEILLHVVSNFLIAKGYSVLSTADGPQGVLIYKNERPHVVLLDIGLPSLDGYKVLKQILSIDAEAKVIIVSGYGSETTALKFLDTGAAAFHHKPVDLKDLIVSIETVLTMSR